MPDDLLIALNPEEDSSLPYLIRIPLGAAGVVLKTRDTWPRTSKLYCHRAASWPADAEIILRLPVRRCTRRGAAIDLILDRARENRSQFVITRARGREMIFWQSPKTSKQARPGVHIPTARAHRQVLEILIDSGEKYPYRFSGQQATTVRERLACGDYAVQLAGTVVAVVERKTSNDLISSMISGRMKFLMAELAELPRAAVVVEEGYGKIFKDPYVGRLGCCRATGRDPGAVPGGADRVLRDPAARRGMDLSLARRMPVRTRARGGYIGAGGELQSSLGGVRDRPTPAAEAGRYSNMGSTLRIGRAGSRTNSRRDSGGLGPGPFRVLAHKPYAELIRLGAADPTCRSANCGHAQPCRMSTAGLRQRCRRGADPLNIPQLRRCAPPRRSPARSWLR